MKILVEPTETCLAAFLRPDVERRDRIACLKSGEQGNPSNAMFVRPARTLGSRRLTKLSSTSIDSLIAFPRDYILKAWAAG